MFDNEALNIAIGLIFVFVLYSLLATILLEIVSGIINLRAALMVKAVTIMLNDRQKLVLKSKNPITGFFKRLGNYIADQVKFFFCRLPEDTFAYVFFSHPSIKYLSKSSLRSKPSYIEPANFSATIVKILRGPTFDGSKPQIEQIRAALYPDNSQTARVVVGIVEKEAVSGTIRRETLDHLRQLFVDAQNDTDRFKSLLEDWFNEVMDRATGWYKRKTNILLFGIGLIIAIWGNVDTVKIYSIIAHDKTAREQLVTMASNNVSKLKGVADSQNEIPNEAYSQVTEALNKSGQVLGVGYVSGDDTLAYGQAVADYTVQNDELTSYSKGYHQKLDSLQQAVKTASGQLAEKLLNQIKLLQQLYKTDYDARVLEVNTLQKKMVSLKKAMDFKTADFGSLIGWLITALAISLGSPFWFDILNKIINLRAAGQKPDDPKSKAADPSSKADVNVKKRIG